MRQKLTLTIFLISINISVFSQLYFNEDFESGEIPDTWEEEFVVPAVSWRTEDGAYEPTPGVQFPNSAKSGNYNALFQIEGGSNRGKTTKLITPAIDLSLAVKPELTFWHAQADYGDGDFDVLRVYIKSGTEPDWILLEEYLTEYADWDESSMFIPDSVLDDSVFIAFEAESNWGFGVVLDSIEINERGVIPYYLKSYSFAEPTYQFAPTQSNNNPMLQIVLDVFGNTGDLYLEDLNFISLNTDNADIKENGVKLFYSSNSIFDPLNQISSSVNIGDTVSKENMHYQLGFGKNYFWITYDVDSLVEYDNKLDLKIPDGGISVELDTQNINFNSFIYPEDDEIVYILNNDTNRVKIETNFPIGEVSPGNSVSIYNSVFYDDFEGVSEWILTGDFEIDAPIGLGGNENGGPDPDFAVSGTKVLGSDLTGLGATPGDYENFSFDTIYYAQSKFIDLTFYKDVYLSQYRWLNAESFDSAKIAISIDSGKTWVNFISYDIIDLHWSRNEIDLSTYKPARKKNVAFRYKLSPDNFTKRSGWNIDNFAVVGDFLSDDVGPTKVVSPVNRCVSSIEDSVMVWVRNYAGLATNDTIPVEYYIVGEGIQYNDTIFQSIDVEDSILFKFADKFNISTPGTKQLVVKTNLDGDEDTSNDSIVVSLYYQPTYNLPYVEEFTSNNGYWVTSGSNSTWQWGTATGDLNPPPSPSSIWKTKMGGNYLNNDSSFFESVCVNIPDSQMVLFDFQYWLESESKKDGFLLEYSLDEGDTWTYFETDTFDWAWNWYNDTTDLLDSMSFTGNNLTWSRARQIVPSAVLGKDRVKFRFHFRSDTANVYRGVGLDDIRIAAAPMDIGISGFVNMDTACQYINSPYLKLVLQNYGINELIEDEEVIIGVIQDSDPIIWDTIILQKDLPGFDTIHVTFTKPLNFNESPGSHSITAFTTGEQLPNVYGSDNDTAKTNIYIYPNPITDLPDSVGSLIPDTFILRPHIDPDYDYLWTGGADTANFDVPDVGWYTVTVTDTDSSGCITIDSVKVVQFFRDLGIDSVLYPLSNCSYTNKELIEVRLHNFGTDALLTGEEFVLAFEFDGGPMITDTILLDADLEADSTVAFTFSKDTIDISALTTYNIKTYSRMLGDTVPDNDTTYHSFEVYGYPVISLGNDTIVKALSYELDPGSGYDSYLWNDSSTTETIQLDSSGVYWVAVTSINGCTTYDTVNVHLKIRDVKPNNVLSPITQCIPNSMETIQIELLNLGNDTITSVDTIFIAHTTNGGSVVNDTIFAPSNIYPDSTWVCEFNSEVDFNEDLEYTLVFNINAVGDLIPENDSILDTVTYYSYPVISLGNDTVVKALSYELDPGSGYDSYLWNDSSVAETLSIDSSGLYWVEVTTVNGCVAYDTIDVYFKIRDVKPMELLTPITQCVPETMEKISLRLMNMGNDTITSADTIFITHTVNGGSLVIDTSFVSADVYPDSTWIYESVNTVNFSENTDYEFTFNINAVGDLIPGNDSLIDTTIYYSYPIVELGNDTIIKALTHEINAGYVPSYAYKWQDDSDSSVFVANSTGWYTVTVTSSHNCSTQDSLWLKFVVPDIGITQLVEPSNLCNTTDSLVLSIGVKNFGTDTISTQDTLTFEFEIGAQTSSQTSFLTNELLPGQSTTFAFNKKVLLNNPQIYNVVVNGMLSRDLNIANDTLKKSLEVLEEPIVDFGVEEDTIRELDSVYILGAGGSYKTYKWSDESTSPTIIIQEDGLYSVTVTNNNGCTGSGDVYVMLRIDTCINNPNCDPCLNSTDCEACPNNPGCEIDTCLNNPNCDPCLNSTDCEACPNNPGCGEVNVVENTISTLSVYPNPASERIYVDVPQTLANKHFVVKIININGQVLGLHQVEKLNEGTEIYLGNINSGIYYLVIDTGNELFRQKIIVNKN